MKTISLTQGKVALVDDQDYLWINSFNWYVQKDYKTGNWYARRSVRVNGKGVAILMHRFILGVTGSHVEVDHKDHNTLNNQRYNIKEGSRSQNQQNRLPKGRSKYLGVSWNKQWGKWFSSISIKNKRKFLGYYKTEEDAAKAYDKEAILVHGSSASVNFK